MSKLVTFEQYLNMLSERTIDNKRQLLRSINQRRNGMEDLYGVCFSAYGDASKPATFYISLSPDYVYLQRFAFKFVIKPYQTTVTGGTSAATVTVDLAQADVNETLLSTDFATYIMPNPHTHTAGLHGHGTQPHTHSLIDGIAQVHTLSTNWTVKIAGIDITAYLIEQQNNAWISGEGIYPNNRIEGIEDFYDILDVASMMIAEGKTAECDAILASEFKKVEIISDAPFGVDAYAYVKYSNSNR